MFCDHACTHMHSHLKEAIVASKIRLRRGRIPFSREEEENLIKGVSLFGPQWKLILLTFKFHPCRTNVDLKDKWRNMVLKKKRNK